MGVAWVVLTLSELDGVIVSVPDDRGDLSDDLSLKSDWLLTLICDSIRLDITSGSILEILPVDLFELESAASVRLISLRKISVRSVNDVSLSVSFDVDSFELNFKLLRIHTKKVRRKWTVIKVDDHESGRS